MKPEYHLYINYYISPDEARNLENISCLEKNIACEFITQIFVLTEERVFPTIFDSDKIEIIEINERPTFSLFFNLTNQKVGRGIRFIIANSDIYFTNSLKLIEKINLNKKIVALTRWDLNKDNSVTFFNKFHSQDVWIYQDEMPSSIGHYFLGQLGCDNRLLQEFYENHFKIKNPSLVVQTIHMHDSQYRTALSLKAANAVKGRYRYSLPTGINHPIIHLLRNIRITKDKRFNIIHYSYIRFEYYRAISLNELPKCEPTLREKYAAILKRIWYYSLYQIVKRIYSQHVN